MYVIGGLVDDSVKKNSTSSYAQNHGIKTAKLPIQEHCERAGSGTFKQIFTINQVFEILMKKANGSDWPQALSNCIPIKTGFVAKENWYLIQNQTKSKNIGILINHFFLWPKNVWNGI